MGSRLVVAVLPLQVAARWRCLSLVQEAEVMRALILSLLLIAVVAIFFHDDPQPATVHVEASAQAAQTTTTTLGSNGPPLSLPASFSKLINPPRARTAPKRTAWAGNVWDRLAQCEARGNWHANTGNGYSGGLQMDAQFWSSYGGLEFAPAPWQATREQQIVVAERGRKRRGFTPWPTCARRLGLLG